MKLDLQPEEAAILKDILSSYLSDLRFEISNTDNYEWRQALKGREEVARTIIARLQEMTATSP